MDASQGPERNVTRIWRHQKDNRALVEYDEVKEETTMGQLAQDRNLPPTQSFHDAMDGLAGFIAGPYGIGVPEHKSIRCREIRLFRKEADGKEVLQVKLYGTRTPDGYDANVSLRTPKEEVTGDLKKAIDKAVKQANAYIDGARGQATLLDE